MDEILCCDGFANITHAHMCFETEVVIVSQQISSKAPSPKKELLSGLLGQVLPLFWPEKETFTEGGGGEGTPGADEAVQLSLGPVRDRPARL